MKEMPMPVLKVIILLPNLDIGNRERDRKRDRERGRERSFVFPGRQE
jgi:hypothetical protein